jgi:hypothetical protein
MTAKIMAITGSRVGRATQPELDAFMWYLDLRGVVVLRHGDCDGIDKHVARATACFRPMIRRSAWPAAFALLKRAAGPRRNGAMLRGDVENEAVHWPWGPARGGGPFESRGLVVELVAWPGDSGTADCCKQARRLGITVTPVADVVARWQERER